MIADTLLPEPSQRPTASEAKAKLALLVPDQATDQLREAEGQDGSAPRQPGGAALAQVPGLHSRGLLVHEKSARDYIGKGKTLELKSFKCKLLRAGDEFFLLECGLQRNRHGANVVKALDLVACETINTCRLFVYAKHGRA